MRTEAQRFFAKVEKTDSCWLWRGCLTGRGEYGQFRSGGRMVPAHRWSYEQVHGPVPEGKELDHLCRNRACVNPAHLEAVTHLENVRRGELMLKGANANAKKETCPQGHPYEDGNIYYDRGQRACRTCVRARQQKAYQRRCRENSGSPN